MRRATILIAIALAALAGAAIAGAAGITVFKTSFSSRAEYRAMRELSGPHKQCKKNWKDKTAVGVVVKGGPVDCTLSSPVQGDAPQSNQIVRVVAKLNKETDDKVKKSVFVGVVTRASRKEGYELRVFPKGKHFELLKSGEVLAQGREKAIEGIAKKNRLQIDAIGQTITGKVNGKQVAQVKDKDFEQVQGRQTGISYGNRDKSKKGQGVAFFDKFKVQVPVP
jgi:hypothetical protein